MDGQLSLFDVDGGREPKPTPRHGCDRPCMWLEEWHGYPFCYIRFTFRVECLGLGDANAIQGKGGVRR